MAHLTEYVKYFMEKLNFEDEAKKTFEDVEAKLDVECDETKRFDELVSLYMDDDENKIDNHACLDEVMEIGEKLGVHEYTIKFVFLMNCTEILYDKYKKAGISDEIFWQTQDDFRCKLNECKECKNIWGTFVASWFRGAMAMNRFALGRFQFEYDDFGCDEPFTTSAGYTLNKGDKILGFHIPSNGVPLTDEVRYDSYKKAHVFFRDYFDTDVSFFACGSWLLYTKHKDFLPPSSNIIKFYNDFEIINSSERQGFGDIWRVFGRYADLPYDQLPKDSGLRKAYAEWLCKENKSGSSYGVIVFDGEKIVK